MKYKPYSATIWNEINHAIDLALELDPNPVAAFDADGTLWDIDLGETFFHYQIDHKLVALPSDPWNHYLEMKKQNDDPRAAYLWLAQINSGQSIDQVKKWAAQAVAAAQPLPVFEEQQKLVSLLINRGIKVYVVTASVKWAVEPGAQLLGIETENVIGVSTKIDSSGKVTNEQDGPISYRQGKAEALLKHTNGKVPFLCSGNTFGDLQLLESASHLRLAVSAAAQDESLYRAERELQLTAKERGWLNHRFI